MRGDASSARRWIAAAVIAVLAVAVIVLSIAAFDRANPEIDPGEAAPVPSFTLGIATQTPTPTPTETFAAPARDAERFLSIGSAGWWRGVAGACGGTAPTVERSTDAGRSWSDVTPTYRGIAQLLSLDSFAQSEAEMVAGLGAACETQALRTFTQGQFWDSYPDVLADSRYIDAADPSLVHLGGGATTAAPCPEATGLRASGDVVALVCDGSAHRWSGEEWMPVAGATDAAAGTAIAVAVSGDTVAVALAAPGCAGVALSLVDAEGSASAAGCFAGADAAAPAALAANGSSFLLWSGDALLPPG